MTIDCPYCRRRLALETPEGDIPNVPEHKVLLDVLVIDSDRRTGVRNDQYYYRCPMSDVALWPHSSEEGS